MSSPASDSDPQSRGFFQLDERIRHWIWSEGWNELRDVQERAIPALIDADRDVILAAATAAGKTEAAFLPILTNLLRGIPDLGTVIYVSPLKALINDQWRRLDALCAKLEIPVYPWHGDITATRKQQFLKKPQGIVLITPESLEALFVNRGAAVPATVARLRYIVVDELHAFIGSERGRQLQSLMHRIDIAARRIVPRVGLSATLGDMGLAEAFLRPAGRRNFELVQSGAGGQEIKILLKGYESSPPKVDLDKGIQDPEIEDLVPGSDLAIADNLYKTLRGTNNLVFPNSRAKVERFADLLRRRCEREGVPNEFWPHHGSLSREFREDAEQQLKQGDRAATAICTTTLELGIDIGAVRSIAQIGPPPSVASLRQRLGRSGRRAGDPAILRGYCVEPPLTAKSPVSDCLREGLVQTIAMTELLLSGWCEPPKVESLHASTLVQQILSLVAERGGITAKDAWKVLILNGPFTTVNQTDFAELLRSLGSHDLIIQDSTGLLLHGELGEKLVNHFDFFAAFVSEEEFRIVSDGRTLGSLPISHPLAIGQRIIFAGRRWQVVEIDEKKKTIYVIADRGGAPPAFGGGGGRTHDRVREQMRSVLSSNQSVPFLDLAAADLLSGARRYYSDALLAERRIVESGADTALMTWSGDWVNDALVLLLSQHGITASNEGVAVNAHERDPDRVFDALSDISGDASIDVDALLAETKNIRLEKWDWALPASLLRKSFVGSMLDVDGAQKVARSLIQRV